jgi:hypothetical protein
MYKYDCCKYSAALIYLRDSHMHGRRNDLSSLATLESRHETTAVHCTLNLRCRWIQVQ